MLNNVSSRYVFIGHSEFNVNKSCSYNRYSYTQSIVWLLVRETRKLEPFLKSCKLYIQIEKAIVNIIIRLYTWTWVFIKNLVCYKTFFMAKWYHQCPNIDKELCLYLLYSLQYGQMLNTLQNYYYYAAFSQTVRKRTFFTMVTA